MRLEELMGKVRCPVCGKPSVIFDTTKHKCIDVVKEVYEVACGECKSTGHVMWNEPRKAPMYCCWPDPK